jgi:methyltransferase (TIGR00027 family)
MRAAETHQPSGRRLLEDPFAKHFVRHRSYRLASSLPLLSRVVLRAFDRRYNGLHTEIVLRNRCYEAELKRAYARGVRQLILLGAGYDSLALRKRLDGLTVFEIDAPSTQRLKREAIKRANLHARTRVEYISCDFERDRLAERALPGGVDPTRPCLTVWLGVSYYLTAAAVCRTLAQIASLSAPGSVLVWDYMDPSVIDGTTPYASARNAAAAVARRGEPYIFGIDRAGCEQMCIEAGFEATQHVRIPELAQRFGPSAGTWSGIDDYMGVTTATRVAV